MRLVTLLLVAIAAAAAASPPPPPMRPPDPRSFTVDWDPNGMLFVDGTLYVADSRNDRIMKWDGNEGFAVVATLPPDGKTGLGQIARLPDGTLAVARFGFGEAGGVALVGKDGKIAARDGLDRKRKRIGLVADGKGRLYTAYHVGHGDGAGLAVIEPGKPERDLLTAVDKPVGVVLGGDQQELIYTDQKKGELRRCKLPACDKPELVARVEGPDLLVLDKDGAVFVGTKDGKVLNIRRRGETVIVAQDLGRVYGVALDIAGRRLFVSASRDKQSYIRMILM